MRLADVDIKTREVLDWNGIHLFHGQGSSCSQKVRIYLNLKGIDWASHPINLVNNENISEFYLGVNPRGLVPCLVHDGAVHIESNDILQYLEYCFPNPSLIPMEHRSNVELLLRHENDLHLALRTITFRFMMPGDKPPKSREELSRYENLGSGTVGGVADPERDREIGFWRDLLDHGGISDEASRIAVANFRSALTDLDEKLAGRSYLLGAKLSVLDIAWVIYVTRLTYAGYPLDRLHPNVAQWANRLNADPAFAREMALPPAFAERIAHHQAVLAKDGRRLTDVCELN